ncbi:MAG: chromosome segregation protein SMC [Desulfuromonas sp.]|nr:MAG: chromosome segregation protein SMC [Desulfuromonas sp.]
MKIKRLEITGFKSFVERTVLEFDAGITSIVGPNGCGKSNIVDAIRWVMGEQSARHLRGKSMEDVIFGGSEKRKPFGMAEVALVMDNTDGSCPSAYRDYAEIQICRRLYRNGESEYLLNKTPCRLLDITELFMDTGVGNRAYSIIEQGKIGMIVNAKPEERRALIEEAAGVTKYKSRKKVALRKIEATRHNLLRLTDIVGEVRRQMNSLKRQAQRAQRFRELREELKEIEVQFALRDFISLGERVGQTLQSEQDQAKQLQTLSHGLEQDELELEALRLAHLEREKESSSSQEQVFVLGADIQKTENRLEFAGKEIEALELRQERMTLERREIEERVTEAVVEEETLTRTLAELAGMVTRECEQLTDAEDRLAGLNEQESELVSKLEQARNDLYHQLSELSRMNSQQEESRRRLKVLAEAKLRNQQEALAVKQGLDELLERRQQLHATLTECEQQRQQLQTERSQLDQQRDRLSVDVERGETELHDKRGELSRLGSRLESLRQLEQSLSGYGRGVKAVLGDQRSKAQMHGLLADFLDVPARYEVAVEAVLGERVQALLARSTDGAVASMNLLQDQEGRCTFILPEPPGFAAPVIAGATPLSNLVASPACDGLVARLLGGVYWVDDLQPYIASSLPVGVTLVDAVGRLFNYRGELTAGGRQVLDQGVLHKKREIRTLAKDVESLQAKVATLERQRDELRRALAAAEEGLRSARENIYQVDLRLADGRKDLTSQDQERSRLEDRLEVLNLEENQLHDEHEELTGSLEQTTVGRSESEELKSRQEQMVARLQRESQEFRLRADQLSQQVTSHKVALAGLREREEGARQAIDRTVRLREELALRADGLVREKSEAVQRRRTLESEISEQKIRLDVACKRRIDAEKVREECRVRFDESRRQMDGRETALRQLRSQVASARDDLAGRQLRSRELQLEREHLRQSFLEKMRLDLGDEQVAARFADEFDVGEGRRRRDYLLKRIDEIGEVNLMAIEEFQELEERYTFLCAQQEDLQQSLEGLLAAITKINRTTRKRFRETFDQVNARFREVFPRLFNGGQAELRLTDESDLLETGIDIVAQPPGKKLQNVTLLSGGEKALTAVSLIFAIFLIKPSPFCLLDEVDAPLDDANIGRFNEMVKMMSDAAQFIIITHNKRTMEIADNLYGVTMEEPGVSKMVSVRMGEVA